MKIANYEVKEVIRENKNYICVVIDKCSFLETVVWRKCNDGTVCWGHYFSSTDEGKKAAIKDFEERSK